MVNSTPPLLKPRKQFTNLDNEIFSAIPEKQYYITEYLTASQAGARDILQNGLKMPGGAILIVMNLVQYTQSHQTLKLQRETGFPDQPDRAVLPRDPHSIFAGPNYSDDKHPYLGHKKQADLDLGINLQGQNTNYVQNPSLQRHEPIVSWYPIIHFFFFDI